MMTPCDLGAVITDDVRVRLEEAVRDLRRYCAEHGEPLTQQQLVAVCSLPLRILLGFEECMTNVVDTYEAIRRVDPEPAWTDQVETWLRESLKPRERFQ